MLRPRAPHIHIILNQLSSNNVAFWIFSIPILTSFASGQWFLDHRFQSRQKHEWCRPRLPVFAKFLKNANSKTYISAYNCETCQRIGDVKQHFQSLEPEFSAHSISEIGKFKTWDYISSLDKHQRFHDNYYSGFVKQWAGVSIPKAQVSAVRKIHEPSRRTILTLARTKLFYSSSDQVQFERCAPNALLGSP